MDPEGSSREPANSEKEWLISAVRTLSRIVAGKEKGQEKIWNIECKPDWWDEKTGGLQWRNPTGNRKDSLQVLQKKYRVLEEYVKAEKRFPESLQKEAELWSTNQFDKLFAFTHLIYFYNEAKKLATVWEKFIKLYPGKDGSLDAEFFNYFKNCKASFKEIQHKMTEYTEQLSHVRVKQTRPNDSRESTPPTPAVVSSKSSYNHQASMSALPKLQRKRPLENVQVNFSEKKRKTQSKTNAPTQSSNFQILQNTPSTLEKIDGGNEPGRDKSDCSSSDEGFSDGCDNLSERINAEMSHRFHLAPNEYPMYLQSEKNNNINLLYDKQSEVSIIHNDQSVNQNIMSPTSATEQLLIHSPIEPTSTYEQLITPSFIHSTSRTMDEFSGNNALNTTINDFSKTSTEENRAESSSFDSIHFTKNKDEDFLDMYLKNSEKGLPIHPSFLDFFLEIPSNESNVSDYHLVCLSKLLGQIESATPTAT
ncbi:uncharacterized protein LOC131952477 [Physella acuta]|uniref:uncharacterized protein LOC131952477 n=1 Tax=Physella acuta TaxID=109671 RepID=UPI0027DBAA8D|nr:uncharacterized protein LOC131952477 [Physella acuta]